jgi:hypothetical protein
VTATGEPGGRALLLARAEQGMSHPRSAACSTHGGPLGARGVTKGQGLDFTRRRPVRNSAPDHTWTYDGTPTAPGGFEYPEGRPGRECGYHRLMS